MLKACILCVLLSFSHFLLCNSVQENGFCLGLRTRCCQLAAQLNIEQFLIFYSIWKKSDFWLFLLFFYIYKPHRTAIWCGQNEALLRCCACAAFTASATACHWTQQCSIELSKNYSDTQQKEKNKNKSQIERHINIWYGQMCWEVKIE